MKIHTRNIVFIALCSSISSLCQDLESLGREKWLNYSGGITFNNTFYEAVGIPNRRDPYFWQLNAHLNFDIFGVVQAPFSFTMSQQNRKFSQPEPFNRFGISPTYRDFTLHLGHRSMNFSPYTLSGNLFFGAGAEYKPSSNPIRVSALYGRFAKPVRKSAQSGLTFAEPTFRRIGYGAKIGFEKDGQEGHVIMFRAKDDPSSIPFSDSLSIRPEENLVLGLSTSNKILKALTLKIEYALSLFSSNSSGPEILIDEFTFVNNLGNLFTPTVSSRYTTALSTNLIFSTKYFQLNSRYRKVDPGYTTHGSSFLNNDQQDISTGISLPLFRNRLSLSVNGGVQQNNLDNQLTAQQIRLIFSSSASWNISEKLQLTGTYGNFNSSTRQVQLQEDILADSLEFFQVSRNGGFNVNYQMGTKENPVLFRLNAMLQDATNSENNTSTFVSNNLSIQKRLLNWNVSITGVSNINRTEQYESVTAGPTTSIGRSFDKGKYRTTVSSSLLNIYTDQQLESRVTNFRFTGNLRPWKQHSFSLSAFYVIKNSSDESETSVLREFRASINYALRI